MEGENSSADISAPKTVRPPYVKKEYELDIPKWMIVLSVVEDRNLSRICRDADVMYAHGHRIIQKLCEEKMVKKSFSGREASYEYTVHGRELSRYCRGIIKNVKPEVFEPHDILRYTKVCDFKR